MPIIAAGTQASITIPAGSVLTVAEGYGTGQLDTGRGFTAGAEVVPVENGQALGPFSVAATFVVVARTAMNYTVAQPATAMLTSAEAEAVAAILGGDKEIITAGTAGTSSAWFPYVAGMRLAYALDSGSTSTTFSCDISADGVTSLGQSHTGTWASTTAEITYPIYLSNPQARYMRFNVLSGGPLSVVRYI